MLLRRMTQHVKNQNWFAVGLDFLIVVIGVFVGLQVNNWNEARAEAEQAYDLLSSIAEDLSIDRAELGAGAESIRVSMRAGNYALRRIGEPTLDTLPAAAIDAPGLNPLVGAFEVPHVGDPGADERDRLWSIVLASFYPSAGSTAYDALTNTGKLGIIRDPGLVSDLQDYYQIWVGIDETHAGTLRPLRNDAVSVGQRYGLSPFSEIPEDEFLEKLKEHEELRAALRTQIGYKIRHYQLIVEADEAAEALLSKLERKGTK
jgi:hypothetical protein